jgi:polysaccharide pyruvyl transferase WcaK-like protein
LKKILYIGWIGYNNLGDDLLWNIFNELCKKHHFRENQIKVVPSFPAVDISNVKEYDTVVLGGGSLIAPHYIKILKKALDMKKKVVIWGSGIDRINENALNKMNEGANLQLKQRFTNEEAALLKYVFSKASFAGVRGPLTKQALISLGVNSEDIQIIGDPGLILNYDSKDEKKEKLIGINWGTTLNNLYGSNEKLVKQSIVDSAKLLIDMGYKIVIYSVWDKDHASCQSLYKGINDSENVKLLTRLLSEKELMTELSPFTLTINYKLHPNLLSMGAKVPFIALGYRFKVFDLAKSIGMENHVISTSLPDLTSEILARVSLIEQNRDEILSSYEERLKHFLPLIERPFHDNFYL